MSSGPKLFMQRVVPKFKWFRYFEPEKYGRGPIGLLKNFWADCPEIVLASLVGVNALCVFAYVWKREKETAFLSNKPYKEVYTVYRPDDPRILRLREEWYKDGPPSSTSVSSM